MRHYSNKILSGVLLVLVHAGAIASPDEPWAYQWDAIVSPETQDSFWAKSVNGTSELTDEGMVLTTKDDEVAMYMVRQGSSHGAWDGEKSMVIEFSARALEIGHDAQAASQLVVSDGRRCAVVLIKNESKDEYRLEWVEGVGRLWVNGEEHPELIVHVPATEGSDEANSLYFGDGSGLTSGKSLWYYIKWKPFTSSI